MKMEIIRKRRNILNSSIKKSIDFFDYGSHDQAITNLYYGKFLSDHYSANPMNYYVQALEIFKTKFGIKNRDVANAYIYIGNYYTKITDYKNALINYQKSLISLSTEFYNTNYDYNPELDDLPPDMFALEALWKKADALFKYYENDKQLTNDLKASVETFDLCIRLTDKVRSSFTSELSKILVSNDLSDIYPMAIKCSIEAFKITSDSNYLEKAFNYSERSRSMILLSELKDSGAKNLGNIPEELRGIERNMNLDLESYRNLIYEEEKKENPSPQKIKLWKDKLFAFKLQHDSLINHFEKFYPKYYQLKYDVSIANISEVQKNLKEGQGVIEYSLSDSEIFIFYITKNKFEVIVEDRDEYFESMLQKVRENRRILDILDYSYADFQKFLNTNYFLYKKLIYPIKDYTNINKLIIIPDKVLGFVPFETLIKFYPSLDTINFKDLPYLLKDFSIGYSSSATLLIKGYNQKHNINNNNVLAFSPAFKRKTKSDNGDPGKFDSKNNLPWAVEEINNIFKDFKGRKFLGTDATKANFIKESGKFNILHFAMHASIDDNNPLSSNLIFYSDSSSKDDGLLRTYEVYNLELTGQLAVLSACSTGSGKLEQGEGIMSMARAFTYAGIPSIVMTLWDVEDRTSSQLMTHFYRYLGQYKDKDEALRSAKLDYLQKAQGIESYPVFWAGYVLYGDSNHLPEPGTNWNYLAVSCSVILLGAFFISPFRHFIRKQKRTQSTGNTH